MKSGKGQKNILTRVFHRNGSSLSEHSFVVASKVVSSLIIVALSFSFYVLPSLAAVNPQINYQAKLTDSSNVAVADGNYIIKFRLYTTLTSATTTAIWEEIRTATGDRASVTSGLFSLMLGSTTPLTNVNFNQTVYLGVEVCGTSSLADCDGEMTPRKVLGASPAAFVSTYVSGSTTPSSFGTTTPLTNTQVTIEATTTTAIPLTLRAATSQAANLFQIQNAAASNLFFVSASGGLFASSTLQVTGASTFYGDITSTGSLLVNNATSTITNLTMTTATSTSATTTYLAVFDSARFGGTATSTFNAAGDLLVVGSTTLQNFTARDATTTNATTTTLYISGTATTTFGGGVNLTTGNVNLPTGGSYLINNANILSATALGSAVVNSSLTSVGIITSGTWRGAAVDPQWGGTGQNFSAGNGWLHVSAGTFTASTSPTINWLTATSTTATSTFATGGLTVGASQFVVQQTSGYVGIGTTTPSDKLSLYAGSFRQAPGNPVLVKSFGIGAVPTAVAVAGRYSYVVDSDSDDLKIIDVSNPAAPATVGTLSLGTVINISPQITVSGRYVYVLDSGNLQIIDVSNPAAPVTVATLLISSGPTAIAISGRYVYVVANSSDDLKIIDVSNPAAPATVGTLSLGGGSTDPIAIAVSGRYGYVVNSGSDDLKIIDVSNPAAPVIVGTLALGSAPIAVAIAGRYGYVVDSGSDDLKIIDVSNPAAPATVGTLVLGTVGAGTSPVNIAIAGRYGYVVDDALDNLKIIDVASPTAPVVVGTLALGSAPTAVAIAGRYGYVVDSGSDDLKIIDVSGLEVTSGIVHSLEAGSLQVRDSTTIGQNLSIRGGLNIGAGGIFSSGPISVSVASSTQTNPVSAYFQGNVGIATTSPYAALSVVGQVVASYFTATSTTATSTFAGAISAAEIALTGTATTSFAGGVAVQTDKFVVQYATGKVGVGTVNPTDVLTVDGGNIKFLGATTDPVTRVIGINSSVGINIPGAALTLSAGDGGSSGTAAGGAINITSGAGFGSTAAGGALNLSGGAPGGAAGAGGAITIAAGLGYPAGGDVTINAGAGQSGGAGGAITINAGAGQGGGVAGNILLGTTVAGKVGIATSTPISTLSIQGSLCVRDTGSCGATAGNIYLTAGAVTDIDVAENYPTADQTIEAGDIVALSSDTMSYLSPTNALATETIGTLVKAVSDSSLSTVSFPLLGVVSTKPGLLLGYDIKEVPVRPVALVGRVPVKVSLQNGEIKIGDRITVSSIPGVGMKATPAAGGAGTTDATVGLALESFTDTSTKNADGVGQIMVFVNLSQGRPVPTITVINNLTPTTTPPTVTVAPPPPERIEWIVSENGRLRIKESLDFDQDVLVKGELRAGKITADEIDSPILTRLSSTTATLTSTADTLMTTTAALASTTASLTDSAAALATTTTALEARLAVLETASTTTSTGWIVDPLTGVMMVSGDINFGAFSLTNIRLLTAQEVRAEKICLGETCLDESILKNLLKLIKNEPEIIITPAVEVISETIPEVVAPVATTTMDIATTSDSEEILIEETLKPQPEAGSSGVEVPVILEPEVIIPEPAISP